MKITKNIVLTRAEEEVLMNVVRTIYDEITDDFDFDSFMSSIYMEENYDELNNIAIVVKG